MGRLDQVPDGEKLFRQAGFFSLVEVPALFAGVLRTWESGSGCVVELHVDHRNARAERHFICVLDTVR